MQVPHAFHLLIMHYEKCIKNKKKLQKHLQKMSSQKRNFLIRVLISGKKTAEKLFLRMDSTINV